MTYLKIRDEKAVFLVKLPKKTIEKLENFQRVIYLKLQILLFCFFHTHFLKKRAFHFHYSQLFVEIISIVFEYFIIIFLTFNVFIF